MVFDIFGVVNKVPLPKEEPPETEAYQFIVPALAVACKDTVPGPQCEAGTVPVIKGVVLIVAVTAVLAETHPLSFASA